MVNTTLLTLLVVLVFLVWRDVLDDEQPNPNARWRRTTDPNDYGSHPPGCDGIKYFHFSFNPDENVIYEDDAA